MVSNIFLYVIFFTLYFWKIKDKLSRPLFSCLAIIYVIASLAACYIAYQPDYLHLPKSTIGVIYHIVTMLILLSAFKHMDSFSASPVEIRANTMLRYFSWLVVFFNGVVIATNIGNVNLDMVQNDVLSIRSAMEMGEVGAVQTGWQRYPYFFGSCYWMVAIALSFYFMIVTPKNKILIYSLLLSSTSILVYGMAIASRDCMLVYFYVFLFLYFIVKKNLPELWRKRTNYVALVGGGIAGAFFILVTFIRFFFMADQGRGLAGTIGYIGQGLVNFQSAFSEYPNGLTHGTSKFPFFVGSSISRFNLGDTISSSLELNVFYTTVGSWVMDVGVWITLIIVFIYYTVIKKAFSLRKSAFSLIYVAIALHFAFYVIFYQVTSMTGTLLFAYLAIVGMDLITRRR